MTIHLGNRRLPSRRAVPSRSGFSLVEMLAVVAILAALALIALPRIAGNSAEANAAACHANQGDVELQAEIWLHNTGSWPAADLSDVGGDANYFPGGLPTCPVDGSSYTIDTNGRVVGHDH